ncbi:hypothetical protein P3T16_003131 [Paraburkholderia sp. GAS42]
MERRQRPGLPEARLSHYYKVLNPLHVIEDGADASACWECGSVLPAWAALSGSRPHPIKASH